MTLAEVIPIIRKLSAAEKLKLIRILAEDLDIADNIAPLKPFKTYDNEYDSLPRISLNLQKGDRSIETQDLVDNGATVNVLPQELKAIASNDLPYFLQYEIAFTQTNFVLLMCARLN